MTQPADHVDPERAAAFDAWWTERFSSRWRAATGIESVADNGSPLLYPTEPNARALPLENDSVQALLALERELNDGQQLSVVAGKEGT